ncbi:MAG TPA: mannose-6-phosphate isomerase, partial [Parachlamydiales bacterium]|nr:mannose-6-phosphate isomerase [Parachlamydiales bacterium]
MTSVYPICLSPVYRDYLWGGEKILKRYGKGTVEGRVAESWEVADRVDGMSVVENGVFRGRTLRELVGVMGERLLGEGRGGVFPLLVKILDAREPLSVQVHPHNETAALVQGEAKSEMWYVLDAEPEAFVYAGVKPGVDWDRLLKAMEGGRVDEVLKKIEVKAN